MKYGLSERVINQIQSVFSNYPEIDKAILYGSRAKGNFRTGSDIDITLMGASLNHQRLNKMKNDLDDLNLPYTFDISLLSEIENPDLHAHINRVGIIFYSKSI